ncbi:hypothetical protein CEXT_156191 [Caerostris extrusa]|uniref:Uncharacterized protein n=1 Tax=Caerostris extrusa TaxID=172846 RepID=A0AAV4Y5D8_CAEEX|nr:hypothetical protein CEXT_156191 [Caerostris extrusa]
MFPDSELKMSTNVRRPTLEPPEIWKYEIKFNLWMEAFLSDANPDASRLSTYKSESLAQIGAEELARSRHISEGTLPISMQWPHLWKVERHLVHA